MANIEREVLGVRRHGDIPGEEIPRTYFNFVRGGDPRRLISIFSHNADDILSLAALTGKVVERLGKVAPEELDPVEVYSLGRMHLRRGALEEASLFLEKSDYDLLPFRIFLRSQKELSMAYKRKGEWSRAVELWIQTIETFDPSQVSSEERLDLFAFEELAKYFEHQEKDINRAIEFTRLALELVETLCWTETEEKLKHRLQRLHRKAGIEEEGRE